MTQVVVTFENDADTSFLRKLIENLKGVLNVSNPIYNRVEENDLNKEWKKTLHELSKSIDSSMIDMSDERTQYIMSK